MKVNRIYGKKAYISIKIYFITNVYFSIKKAFHEETFFISIERFIVEVLFFYRNKYLLSNSLYICEKVLRVYFSIKVASIYCVKNIFPNIVKYFFTKLIFLLK